MHRPNSRRPYAAWGFGFLAIARSYDRWNRFLLLYSVRIAENIRVSSDSDHDRTLRPPNLLTTYFEFRQSLWITPGLLAMSTARVPSDGLRVSSE
jgi:hypothetical protein